ncbi:MAG: polymerase, sigma-24 subunit, subfamily [Pedosphaera sp.]|nr:polymerase, sigma-24 subunit, subfamily [Pedosphaera sp.]
MDTSILTTDLSNKSLKLPGRRIKGILGMDCLRHYCIQLDFETGRIRFLDPNHPGSEDLGQAFHLSFAQNHPLVGESLIGVSGGSSTIDTGCNFDGLLTPRLYRRWTNQPPASPRAGEAHFPNGVFGGSNYTNLYLHGDGGANLVGLTFLARNLVTLNFPKRTMYLKQRSARSLAEGNGFFDEFYPDELRKRLCKP